MNLPVTIIIGACAHALIGAGVLFAKEEPNKVPIFIATTLKGLLVALLIGFSLNAAGSRGAMAGAGFGLLFGLAFGVVVFLAKGADRKSSPYLLSGSAIQGVISGVLIALIAFSA